MIIQTDENNEIKNKLEIKERQIQTLQIKLDSQDIIIKDYYFIKDKLTLSKNEILNLKKKIEDLNSNKSSLEFELKKSKLEKDNLQNNIDELKNQIKEIKIKL
jgi:chromosome segregation ATPase